MSEVLERTRNRGHSVLWDRETVVALYLEAEMTTADIADHVNCALRTVRRWLDRHDIDHRHRAKQGPPK